jgi:hypothetical protein
MEFGGVIFRPRFSSAAVSGGFGFAIRAVGRVFASALTTS